jgi:phage regulator Rha-like protein
MVDLPYNQVSLSDRVSETLTLRQKPRPRIAIVPSFGCTGFFFAKGLKMNDLMTTSTNALTMNSLEIAQLTGKRHDNVMTDIRAMMVELEVEAPEISGAFKMPSGQNTTVFNLDKELTLTLVSGYSIKMRHAIVRRWQELETAKPTQHALDLYASQLITDGILPGMVAWWGEYLVEGDTTETMDELGYSYRKYCRKHGFYPSKERWGECYIYKKKDFVKSLRIVSGVCQITDLRKIVRPELVRLHKGHVTNTLRLSA